MYIDTHCHLTFPQFDEDRAMVIGNAKKAGVKKFIIPGASIHSSRDAVAFTQTQKDCLYAAIGVHPHEAPGKPDISVFETLLSSNVVAVGECGLDYHLFQGEPAIGKKTEQQWLFDAQLRFALKHDLPVIIHCRDAFMDIFTVLDTLPAMPKGVFHCFGGTFDDVKNIEKRGFYIGVDGNVTYSKQLAAVVPQIPLSMLLLETDAPLLPPAPHRGERNEPKYIPLIAKRVSELLRTTPEEVERQSTENAKRLFVLNETKM